MFYLGWEQSSVNEQVHYTVSLIVINSMNMDKHSIEDTEERCILNSVFKEHLTLTIVERSEGSNNK